VLFPCIKMNKLRIIWPFFFLLLLIKMDCFSQNTLSCPVKAKFSNNQDSVVTSGSPVLLSNQSVNAGSYAWYQNGSFISSAADFSVKPVVGVNAMMLIASNGTCSDTAYSYIIWNGNAGTNGIMKKQFNPSGMAIEPFCMASDKANGYLLAGAYFPPAPDNLKSKTTCLIRIDEKGCVIWSKTMITGQEEVIQSIIASSDTGFLVSAFPYQSQTDNYPNSLIVFKLDKQGNIEWAHSYNNGTSVSNYLSAICETDDKGFVLESGSFPANGNPSFISIIKIDKRGVFTWGRQLAMENDALYNVGGILEKNGFIYASGSMYTSSAPFGLLRSFLTRLDLNTGQTIWTKQSDPQQAGLSFTDIHIYKTGLLLNSFTSDLLNNLIFMGDNGNPITAAVVNNPYGSLNGRSNILLTPDGALYIHQPSGSPITGRRDIIMRLDNNMQILWQHDFYSQDLRFDSWYQMSPAPDYGMSAIGSGIAASGLMAITFLKLDSSGTNCSSGESELNISATNPSLIPMTWNRNAGLSMRVTDLQPLTMESRLFCPGYLNGCDLLKLDGPRMICQPGESAMYILHKDPSCPDPITWSYDSSDISVPSKNPAGMVMRFAKTGTYKIKVKRNSCVVLEDSITVVVGNNPSGLTLPRDTTLCSGNDLILNAGSGYNSYQWQDGSDRQSIRVSATGTYWVRLEDRNGCMHTDTTFISKIVPLPSDFLPADTAICSYAPLLIQSRQVYSSYLWNTGETGAAVQIKDQGVYILRVVDKNGCEAADTIRVIIKNCPYGIYFPNAFTPNKDGYNDLFRPVVIGYPVKYRFSIYNRWGQCLFNTSDPKMGWDGTLSGADQETGTYAWICAYQFGGEKENRAEGSFVLVR